MQLSLCHVTLGLVAVLAMVCKVYSSDSSASHLQGEVRKRIFCNFYGCGSKRSANNMADIDSNMADLDFSSDHVGSLGQDENMNMATREAALAASQKILRAASLWEAIKERLQQDRAQQLFKRNSS